MKTLIAIALLGLQMFTICGHLALYQYAVYQSDRLFNDMISKNMYNIHDLVEIKIPQHIKTIQNWSGYERINGQVQFKNTCYNYIKLKLTKDTIYLVCIPNYEKTRLFNQNIINAKDIADIPVNKKDHVPFGKILDLGQYNFSVELFKLSPQAVILRSLNTYLSLSYIQRYKDIPHQPPKTIC